MQKVETRRGLMKTGIRKGDGRALRLMAPPLSSGGRGNSDFHFEYRE